MMIKINSKHALDEIKANIKSKDSIKARLVLDHFFDLTTTIQKEILKKLDKAPDQVSIPLIVYLIVTQPEISTIYPELEQKVSNKAFQNPEVVGQCLSQEKELQRFYLLKLAGDLNLRQAVPEIINILLSVDDSNMQAAALSSLGNIGVPEAVNAISEFLYVEDFELVRLAVEGLGKITTSTAMQRLSESMGRDPQMDILIMDVFAVVQDEISLRKLNGALQSRSALTRKYARNRLIKVGMKASPVMVDNFSSKDTDHLVLSLNVIQEIGDSSAALAVRKLINSQPKDPNIRFAAYEALADISGRKGDYVLAGGLSDSDASVRLAAAKAIDRNLDETLAAGIRNLVASPGEELEQIVDAVINGQAENLFTALLEQDCFRKRVVKFLGSQAHPEIREFFVSLLLKGEHEALVNDILRDSNKKNKAKKKGLVCAVDDSKMILNIYRACLADLGYETKLFAEPSKAVAWLMDEKPDVLCVDLNMPGMTGVELTTLVREKYPQEELPIIMVTTQNEGQDHKAAWKAGVDEILQKPFDSKSLAEVFKKV